MALPLTPNRGPPSIPLALTGTVTDRGRHGSSSSSQAEALRTPANTVAVLPTSLPGFHRAFMDGHPTPTEPLPSVEAGSPREQTAEEKVATARRLKPHSRSQVNLDKTGKPERMTPLPSKKSRPTKWQFGIRSRNQPAEAMLAIYKALRAMGADWEVPRIRRPGRRSRSGSQSRSRSSGSGSSTPGRRQSDTDERWSDEEGDVDQYHGSRQLELRNAGAHDSSDGYRGRSRQDKRAYPGPKNDWGYEIPEDPWVINARYRKQGMFPPGVLHPSSTHSSRVDLTLSEEELARRRAAALGSDSSLVDQASYAGPGGGIASNEGSTDDLSLRRVPHSRSMTPYPEAEESCYVYLTIQLYSIDADFFLVDFKCAGYETLAKEFIKEVKQHVFVTESPEASLNGDAEEEKRRFEQTRLEWHRIATEQEVLEGEEVREREVLEPQGRAQGEKYATSPFPFLDVASALIIQLAEGEG